METCQKGQSLSALDLGCDDSSLSSRALGRGEGIWRPASWLKTDILKRSGSTETEGVPAEQTNGAAEDPGGRDVLLDLYRWCLFVACLSVWFGKSYYFRASGDAETDLPRPASVSAVRRETKTRWWRRQPLLGSGSRPRYPDSYRESGMDD
jgi:hypothetical protein